VDVDQMYGIEIEEWPARIAEVAMWLIDHQMNERVGEVFGSPVLRLPLKKSARIVVGNALRIDWNEVLPAARCSYVMGNPPFVGKKEQNAAQKADMALIWQGVEGSGTFDYVTCWYRRASMYTKGREITAAFVSTNSICQGEQVGLFWKHMFAEKIEIQFAHKTFGWMSEAKGKAHVHVVIIGFRRNAQPPRVLHEYDAKGKATTRTVRSINPYLVEGDNIVVLRADKPISQGAPIMTKGSEVTDNGHLLLSSAERAQLLKDCPGMVKFVRRFTGGEEFLNGLSRYCLWLRDASPRVLRSCKEVRLRLEAVRDFRRSSRKQRTRGLADTPYLFGEDRQPETRYLLVPKISSERRHYIPIGFLPPSFIASGSALVVPGASYFDFGMLSSEMHMAWVRYVCGRLEMRYQYSVNIVYNNFPWPRKPTAKQKAAVETAARHVLEVRKSFKGYTLAELYDPLSMPKPLREAHKRLDRAVDRCYRSTPFNGERSRVEFLFDLYQQLTAPLLPTEKGRRRGKRV
ncbi:MAG: class I SAM-dependent DNA methyltransferase, partial [Candidatus Omnitrophica bacterium]|nr:class I SAM-dependent DNA methyltransferase [Candidatus Omnitrophota bacterium]